MEAADRLGLPLVPPFLGQSGRIEDVIHGHSYASAASGILFSSGSDLSVKHAEHFLREEAAADVISNSIFYVSIGSNDFIHYYLGNVSNVQSLYSPSEFNRLLATAVEQELKNLYNSNVRKVVVMELAPIGCTPHCLWQYSSKDGQCVDDINKVVTAFNREMRRTVEELGRKLPDAKVAFCDAFEGSMDILANRQRYGFETTVDACCGLGQYGGLLMCLIPEMACNDTAAHIWWDEFHPTDAANRILADNVWSDMHANMCCPMNMREMVRLEY